MIEQIQQEIIQDFNSINSWEDRYKKIIAIGKDLAPMDQKYKIDENRVKGCQSLVWMFAELDKDGRMVIQADSDALIVRGLIALLLKTYSLAMPKEILNSEPHFIKDIGLHQHLSPTRTNGLLAMVKQIKYYALAYSMKNK
ncbi:MAG: SufE family protein [Bdellovibrionaceae bacterium]|nr:SufE family protein [Pseudobdellovibrionaceae bacterium]